MTPSYISDGTQLSDIHVLNTEASISNETLLGALKDFPQQGKEGAFARFGMGDIFSVGIPSTLHPSSNPSPVAQLGFGPWGALAVERSEERGVKLGICSQALSVG